MHCRASGSFGDGIAAKAAKARLMEGQAKLAAYLTSTCLFDACDACYFCREQVATAMLQVSAICLTACFDDVLLDLLIIVVVVIVASVVTAS